MLRTYEGIFDLPVFVSELLISQLLRQKEEDIKRELILIAAFGIIDYAPQNDSPQITFRKNRVASADLLMNLTLYQKRKEAFVGRVEKMIAYTNCKQCRSLFINHYFGDKETTVCGICDHCLQAKAVVLSNEEFSFISNKVHALLLSNQFTIQQLTEALQGISKRKAWKVIDFLQAEQKITLDKNGILKNGSVV